MSQKNMEVVQAAFDAFEEGDIDGVLRLCDENIEITQPCRVPWRPATSTRPRGPT